MKDKDLKGLACGGVSVSVSGFWVVLVVGFISMALFGTLGVRGVLLSRERVLWKMDVKERGIS